MEIIKFAVGDTVELKKSHPCGTALFKVARVGSDIRLICHGCNRDMTMNRIKLEKALKKHISSQNNGDNNER